MQDVTFLQSRTYEGSFRHAQFEERRRLPYYCGGWATETTPAYSAQGMVAVYGKFTRTVLGNPIGVGKATATATVFWPVGSTNTESETTTSDG